MTQPTMILTVSLNTLDNLHAGVIQRHYSSEFWEDVTSMSWDTLLYGKLVERRREFLCKVRKVRVLINRFFIGQERDIMLVLLRSASPIADVLNMTSMCRAEAYRKVNYLRRVMVELYNYFERKTYREADRLLRRLLTPQMFRTFHIFAVCRSGAITAELLQRNRHTVWRVLESVLSVVRKNKHKYVALEDVYKTWRRLSKIRRTYYGAGKKTVTDDLELLKEDEL